MRHLVPPSGTVLLYQKQMAFAARLSEVAKVIYDAVTTQTAKLRWQVGGDAKRFAEGRLCLTDEEYIAGAGPMSIEEYLERAQRTFGFNWK